MYFNDADVHRNNEKNYSLKEIVIQKVHLEQK